MIFYSTLSGLPTNFISFYTTASRCPRSSYTGYLGRSKALCLQGNWFCAPITHKKRNAPPHICLCILFFWYALYKNVARRVCQYYVYLSIRELQNCSDMQLPSPGQLTLFFKEHLSNPLFACSWDSPTHQIVRALPSNKPPFQNTHFTSYHPLWVNRGFIKGEAMRFPLNNLFEISVKNHKNALRTSNNASKQAGILHNI